METRSDPWYLHAALYLVIAILTVILIKVAIIDPTNYVEEEKYNQNESRLRMDNLKEAEILWQQKFGHFTDSADSLIAFIKSDPLVDSVRHAVDTVRVTPDSTRLKSLDPFKPLLIGQFVPDSIKYSVKSHRPYIIQIDTSTAIDTVINRRGKITRIDTTITLGSRYYIEDPDGYGTIGSLTNDALKNTSSWE